MDILALLSALALVALNGFFVATEFAIVKVRPTRIEELIRKRKAGAHMVKRITANLDGYLSATQLGITLSSLGLGWLGEPAFASLLRRPLAQLHLVNDETLTVVSFTCAFTMISFLHIVAGELAPKSMAILRAEAVSLAVAYPMRFFYVLFFPFVWALNRVAGILLKMAGVGSLDEGVDNHSEDELKIILAQARRSGNVGGDRGELLRKAMSLPEKTVGHLMVPRNDVIFFDVNLTVTENLKRAQQAGHTHFPLCDRELDDVIGSLDVRDVLFKAREREVDLRELAEPAVYLPEIMSAERLLSEFRSRGLSMAVVVDEYGGAAGIVTATDLAAAVMGEMDDDEVDMVALPGGAYDVDGVAPLEEVEEALGVSFDVGDEVRTLAGFLMKRMGRVPRPGDRLGFSGYTFQVMDIHGPRIRRIRIQRDQVGVAPPHAGASAGASPVGGTVGAPSGSAPPRPEEPATK